MQFSNRKLLIHSTRIKLLYLYIAVHVQWIIFIGVVLCIKGVILYFDSLPMFFLGDSQSYLATALNGWIPNDRSFVYGFVIRFIAVYSHSLTVLIAFQVLISTLTALFAAYSLERFFCVRRKIAFTMGMLCAIEPLQLLYERYVLTETVSLFIFAIYMLLLFNYLEKPRISSMVFIQVIGTALISLRLSFLPFILFNAFIIPLFAIPFFRRSVPAPLKKGSSKSKGLFSRKKWMTTAALHVTVSLAATFFLHSAYKQLNGFLVNAPPEYQYQSGFFLLADWAPVVKAEDLPYPGLSGVVFSNLRFDLTDRSTRGAQRWMVGGLISNIKNTLPDTLEADKVAKRTAINALKRDPRGVVFLAAQGFADYWDRENLEKCMMVDRGGNRELPPGLLQVLQENFDLDAESFPTLQTLTNSYYFAVWPWYLFLLLTPLCALFSLFFCDVNLFRQFCIIFIATSVLVIVASVLIERPTIRYLHALEWLFVLILGSVTERLLTLTKGNNGNTHRKYWFTTGVVL